LADPNARSLAWGYAPDASSPWHAQLVGYQIMPAATLLCAAPVLISFPIAALLAPKRTRSECVSCGEEVFDRSEVELQGQLVCAASHLWMVVDAEVGAGPEAAIHSYGYGPAPLLWNIADAWHPTRSTLPINRVGRPIS
jgi:hypothetical protein